MNKSKSILFYCAKFVTYGALFALIMLLFLNFYDSFYKDNYVKMNMVGTNLGRTPVEIYYLNDSDKEYTGDNLVSVTDLGSDENYSYKGKIRLANAYNLKTLRVDFGDRAGGTVDISKLEFYCQKGKITFDKSFFDKATLNQMEMVESTEKGAKLAITGDDAYMVFNDFTLTPIKNHNMLWAAISALISVLLINRFVRLKAVYTMAKDLYGARKLIWSLSKNDFKTKYSGSYFGIIWAFVQPICTILVFWFVFQMGFKNHDVGNVPYIIWFMCGLIPWFFFSEAWGSATNALIEYSYLVKKVVFKVHILPLVKIISALFVHLFFLIFMICVFLIYGIKPNSYWIQVLYYCVCMIVLVISLSFVTAPLVVFFKDLGQIMNIILQFGMWLTPIMWSIDMIPANLMWLFKLNPMYYVVQGYRDSLIFSVPFYNNIKQTLYFWLTVLVLMLCGCLIFRKLKPHFADVL